LTIVLLLSIRNSKENKKSTRWIDLSEEKKIIKNSKSLRDIYFPEEMDKILSGSLIPPE